MEVRVAKVYNPYPAGETNVYIINDELVFDSGINLPQSVDMLKKALSDANLDFESARLVISHPHADHFGSAYLFRNVMAHENACHKLYDAEKRYFELVYAHFGLEGMPEALAEKMRERAEKKYAGLVKPCTCCGRVGEKIEANGDVLDVIHVPGHSYGHIALYHRESGSLFSGDILLDGITPNPVIEPLNEFERMPVLEQYLNTLKKLYGLEVSRVYPGHRGVIENHRKVIEEYVRSFENRSFQVLEIADEKTAFEIATTLFDDIRQLFLIMSETIAQVDFLANRGFLERGDDGRYRVTAERRELEEEWRGIKEEIFRA
ncbi:MBL fold metallo-hydrolase [Geoglobus ahangari]